MLESQPGVGATPLCPLFPPTPPTPASELMELCVAGLAGEEGPELEEEEVAEEEEEESGNLDEEEMKKMQSDEVCGDSPEALLPSPLGSCPGGHGPYPWALGFSSHPPLSSQGTAGLEVTAYEEMSSLVNYIQPTKFLSFEFSARKLAPGWW